jgi:hypothetical protein
MVLRSLYLLITLFILPLVGCACETNSPISDTCSSCHEHVPTNDCSHPCLDQFEVFTKDTSPTELKTYPILTNHSPLYPQPVRQLYSRITPIGCVFKDRLHIQFRVIQV